MHAVYHIKRVRSRFLRLRVHADGHVVVTAPKRVSLRKIRQFLASNEAWIVQQRAEAEKRGMRLLSRNDPEEYRKHKQAAMAFAAKRLRHFNAHYGFRYTRLGIRNSRTRWGSCSRNGSICFSYKILLLPPALADYLVVHELCHCKAFNHSGEFWRLVAETIPDYVERMRLLKMW